MLEWESFFILQHLMIFQPNRHHIVILFGLFFAIPLFFVLAACSTLENPQIQVVTPPSETPLASTPTIIWFPLSATPSPQVVPTKRPTPEQKPGVGDVILTDNFSSASVWNTAASDQASVDVSNNQLTIAVQPGFSAASLRQDITFTDFYTEITARPSLCRGSDEYGLVFRAPNNIAYYRLAVYCNGTAGVDRFSVRTPHVLIPSIPSADVPPGAPGEVRLGIWAAGSEFHFFLNDHYQFSMSDKSYPTGGIGVFAQSAGDTPVTVTFSDLVISEVTYHPPIATPKP
jgi:hypothetical protein